MSTATEFQPDQPSICDTVVVNYFLGAGQVGLLAMLLGVVRVPEAVYNTADNALPEELRSELARGLLLHRRRVNDDSVPEYLRERSKAVLPNFETLPALVSEGTVVPVALTGDELRTFANLRDPDHVARYGLAAGLGPGEASALAISVGREWHLATDDNDAIKVAAHLTPSRRPLRIRALLMRAVDLELVSLAEARAIHGTMKGLGFWDSGTI
jgi:hypothetical protein